MTTPTDTIQLPFQVWRDITKNNDNFMAVLDFDTDRDFLPHALTDIGAFDSTSQVKKNRPDLWRKLDPLTIVTLKRVTIVLRKVVC